MKNKTLEHKTDPQISLSPYQAEPAEAQQAPRRWPGQMGRTLAPPGSEATVRAHAASLNRTAAGPLRRLQRQYGNRYVQRVVELAQRRGGAESFTLDDETAGRINRARGGGQPLDRGVAERMGDRLGHDFSGVRVHTDSEADALSQQLSARAFTIGWDIFFRQRDYHPGTGSGRELIAHELTHVIQQSTGRAGGGRGGMTVNPEGDVYEQEAAGVARRSACASHEIERGAGASVVQRMAAVTWPLQQTGGTCGLYSLGMAISALDSSLKKHEVEGPLMEEILVRAAEVGTFVGEFFDADNLVKVANQVRYGNRLYKANVEGFSDQSSMITCLAQTGPDAALMAYSVKVPYKIDPRVDPELCAHWSVIESLDTSQSKLKVRDPNRATAPLEYTVAEFYRWNESTEAKKRFSFKQFAAQKLGVVQSLRYDWVQQLMALPLYNVKRLMLQLKSIPTGLEVLPINLKGKVVRVAKR